MPSSRRFFWGKKRKKTAIPRSAVFFVTAVFAVLALAVALPQTLPRRQAVGESLPTDFARLLPAAVTVGEPLELPDLPQPSYVVPFTDQAGDAAVALLVWDRNTNAHARVSTLGLSDGDARVEGMPTLAVEALGRGAPPAVIIRGPSGLPPGLSPEARSAEGEALAKGGAYAEAVLVALRRENSLVFATLHDENGIDSIARFPSSLPSGSPSGALAEEGASAEGGASARHTEEIVFGDVDGDGDKDAVRTSTETDAWGDKTETVRAYAWIDGGFSYDQELSWTLTMRKKVFPEPEAPPAP